MCTHLSPLSFHSSLLDHRLWCPSCWCWLSTDAPCSWLWISAHMFYKTCKSLLLSKKLQRIWWMIRLYSLDATCWIRISRIYLKQEQKTNVHQKYCSCHLCILCILHSIIEDVKCVSVSVWCAQQIESLTVTQRSVRVRLRKHSGARKGH